MTHFEDMTLDEFEHVLRERFDEMVALLRSKRQSYGPFNLTRFGPIGIVIRASDKIDRLTTMCNAGSAACADGDTMDDAWRDLIGYGVLGLILTQTRRGTNQ